jgi:hypothetical protein
MNVNDYKNIHGWFYHETDGQVFDYIIDKLPPNSNFAECGVWLGRSTCYSNYLIQKNNKNINHYAFDNFDHENLKDPNEENIRLHCKDILNGEKQLDVFIKNCNLYNIYVKPVVGDFDKTIQEFPNDFFDAFYIDMMHDYDSVYKNLNNAYKKVKKTGIICGHDYGHLPVSIAVKDFLKNNSLITECREICGSFIIEL